MSVAAGSNTREGAARTNHSAQSTDRHLIASYQSQICELEWSLTRLQKRNNFLSARVDDSAKSQMHFQELFECAPIGYVVHDLAGTILEINRAAKLLLGYGGNDHIPGSLVQFVSREDIHGWLDHMRRCGVELHASSELTFRSLADNKARVVQLNTIVHRRRRGSQGKDYTLRTTLIDVTQRRQAENALAQTQNDYHRLIDAVEGIVWEAKARTLQFTFVSHYAERLLGYPVTEWTRPGFWQDRIYAQDREYVANRFARLVENREELVIEYRVLAADRRIVWLHDNITAVDHQGEQLLRGVAIDVSQRREAEESLRQARDSLEERVAERTAKLRETVADLEAFSYSLSHDMRSPLRAMQGYAALLEGMLGDKLGTDAQGYLRRIMRSAERLDALVQDVLTYGRVARAPLELKPIPLERLVENIINDYPSLARVREQIQVQQPILPVFGHEAFVGQALSNILTNAVKFMPPGRTPQVRLWTEEARREEEEGKRGELERWVRVWVQDNGIGLAPQDQRRIFRIFERIHPAEKYDGTGIGLAIVQKAVERMGGRVGVQSEQGRGSRFWIELRRAPQ